LFGFGFGFTISQLSNLTLSAASVQQAGEASGVNNTSRQLGSSLGQALIGALLIAALTSQLNGDIRKSTALPAAAKPAISKQVITATQSLGTSSSQGGAPSPFIKEILRIKNDAIVKGARTGMLGIAGASLLALIFSIRLPQRAQEPEDVDSPETA
jgi:hypothetical protein